jgi:hypothetical protein
MTDPLRGARAGWKFEFSKRELSCQYPQIHDLYQLENQSATARTLQPITI